MKMSCEELIERINQAREKNGQAKMQAEAVREQRELYEILDNNQVENDEMVTISGKDMTKTEARMLRNIAITGVIGGTLGGMWAGTKLKELRGIEKKATDESQRPDRYPRPEGSNHAHHDGHQDAFRHAYMSALMSRAMGPDWAQRFTDAHEREPGSSDAREAMDLHNNGVGLRIARENPDASDEELSNLIYQAVEDGEMVVIKGNEDGPASLAWSDNRNPEEQGVPLWGHKDDSGGVEEREDGPFTLPPGL